MFDEAGGVSPEAGAGGAPPPPSPAGPPPPPSPRPQPSMAFTIDLDEGKVIDTHKYENLVKKSQARHQRVHSMSAGFQRVVPAPSPSPATPPHPRKPPMSAKLPRRLHGYHSEGYFSSDQEERSFSKQPSPGCDRPKPFDFKNSKSPIVDSIMSRSDTLPSRRALNLPLKHPHTASLNRVTPDFSPDCFQSFATRPPHFRDHNLADVPLIADTSSPELDLLTPDNVLLTPGTPSRLSLRRGSSGGVSTGKKSEPAKSPNLTANKNTMVENDGNISPSSTVSEAGTYTIEADNYTEEQKAKMNIDEAFCIDDFTEPIRQALDKIQNAETPLKELSEISETVPRDLVITKEPRSANFVSNIREELLLAKSIPDPIRKVSTDKNVLEISCCYESPTESSEPPQSGKPVKSAKNYLDKIKSRMKNISEKTFQKSPKTPEASVDVGSFTSVTASGVLGSMKQKISKPEENKVLKEKFCRKNSLTKSQIDSSEYVHHIQRDNLVLQNVTNDSFTPLQEKSGLSCDNNLYESEEHYVNTNKTPEQILVSKLSHLSLNRCKGDKSWIQEWADSVKKHNKEIAIGPTDVGLPPISPRHSVFPKGVSSPVKSISSSCNSPTKIPSPVGTLVRQRAPVPDILTSTPDTESYLQSTQNVITNLQAKLQNAKSTPLSNLDISLNIFQDKLNLSKLPVSQLNRSNSLNYRLYRKNNSAESSPLRNPGNYLVTGTHGLPSSTRLLLSNLGASKSLDTDPNISPIDRYLSPSHKSSYKKSIMDNEDILVGKLQLKVGGSRAHLRHHSFDGRNAQEYFNDPDQLDDDFNNANMTQSLNLKCNTNNIYENSGDRMHRKSSVQRHLIDSTTRNILSPSNYRLNTVKLSHHRGLSDTYATQNSQKSHKLASKQDNQGSPIRRSSSFNVVNKNNNIYSLGSPVARVSSAGKSKNSCHRPQDRLMQTSCEFSARNNTPELDCMSEDSDNLSTGGFYSDYDRRSMRKTSNDLLTGARYNRAFVLRRARLESPDARVPHNNSPRCPSTPEMKRKFPNEQSKRPARSHSRDSRSIGPVGRITDVRPDVCQVSVSNTSKNQKNKKITDITKQNVSTRLTRSTSTAKELTPKLNDKNSKKNKLSNITISTKEIEFTNWKKRASYDPMKAVQEGKKNKAMTGKVKLSDIVNNSVTKVEDISSPSNSSPVHRSKSFNCTGTPIDEHIYLLQQNQIEGSSDTDDFEDRLICTLPADGSTNVPILKMISATDINPEVLSAKSMNVPDVTKRTQPVQNNKVKLSTDYIAKLQVNPNDHKKILADKRRTYLINDGKLGDSDSLIELDRRRTIVLDSDTTTNSTTNGSGGSRRNSSVYSDERGNNERLSDSDVESDTEPVTNVVHRTKSRSVPPQQRHSGDFSMSSSTCSGTKDASAAKKIQPRYLDISRYKNSESTTKNFLRRDPSKTYVGVLPAYDHKQSKKNIAKQLEQEQKTKELEKWKRRASYDPRKSAAQAKAKPVSTKSPSNSVLRSQSFHGPMMPNKMSAVVSEKNAPDMLYHDASSDNDF